MIDKCKRGESSGFTGLYNLHAKEVYNSIYRIINHTAEAEDILQESFLAAFQAIGGFENTGGFRAWVKRVAINKSIDRLRKKKIKFVELEPTRVSAPEEDPIDEETFAFEVEKVRKAIDELPEGDKLIVQLYLFENIPQMEIAQMLGITNNAVRTQYHRAKQKVLRNLKGGIS
ncbi:RNA polymerase sigma factor [Chitinophagaceae bacterium LWZ2-11]